MNAQTMIAVRGPGRTAPAALAACRDEPGPVPTGRRTSWNPGGTAEVDPAFRAAARRLRAALALVLGETILSVAAGNTVTPLWTGGGKLPFPDATFDAVVSVFGAMFAPDHRRMADELLRVCRPGGRIGLTCWTPEGFGGALVETVAGYRGLTAIHASPARWGEREYLDGLLGAHADGLGVTTRTHTWRYPSPADWLASWRSYGGPLHDVYLLLDTQRRSWLTSDLLALVARFNEAKGGAMVVRSEYLELIVHKSTRRA